MVSRYETVLGDENIERNEIVSLTSKTPLYRKENRHVNQKLSLI